MLKLYNAGASVCSVKVRLGLAEKGLEWEDELLVLPRGDQFDPEYLRLNPNGVVPTLVHDALVVTESSVILEYIDGLRAERPMMPTDPEAIVTTKTWLLRCLDIHAAINTMTFSTVNRDKILASQTPEQIAAGIAKMPNPKMAAKRRDLLDKGIESSHVAGDFFTLKRLFDDMDAALSKTTWLTGDDYLMADVALLAYVDRLDQLALSGLWQDRTPSVGHWLEAARKRPSYERAMAPYQSADELASMLELGKTHWPAVKKRWEAFLTETA